MSESTAVQLEVRDGVALLTMNHPPVNALSHDIFEGIRARLDALEKDPSVKVLVLTGAGEKAFCAGADLGSGFGQYGPVDFLQRGQDIWNKIEYYPKPVIAAINGNALGGGCELAMACHIRIMASQPGASGKTGVIGLSETSLGIIPGYGGTLRMPRLVGRSKALRYMLLGERLTPQQALEDGLVDILSGDPAATVTEAMEFAARLAKRPPLAMKAVLRIMALTGSVSTEHHLRVEREELAKLFTSKDMMEGMTAFAQKREPNFTGQ
jgi:enoyl-CoA hydratase/carnithine racemase